MQTLKIILSFLISIIPVNILRIFFYKFLFSYKIDFNSKIGFANIILCKNLSMVDSKIGNFNIIEVYDLFLDKTIISNLNLIKNFNTLNAKNYSLIGSYNNILGKNSQYGKLYMNKSQFTTSHIVNINNELNLNEDVVFGGVKSKINIGDSLNKTSINKNVYFGSSIYLSSGIKICEKVLVGSGATVCEDIKNPGLYVSNQIRKITNEKKN